MQIELNENQMTEIVSRVIAALQTNSVAISDLTQVSRVSSSDYIEVSGGKRIAVSTIINAVIAAIGGGGGGGGGGASGLYPIEPQSESGSSGNAILINPNCLNKWGSVSSLYVKLDDAADDSVMNEYLLQFSIGSGVTNPTISIDGAAVWASSIDFQGGKTYQISIVNGYAIGVEFDTITSNS